jgi:hypothetical protein
VIWLPLIIQVPDPSDKRRVAVLFCPLDASCSVLSAEDLVGMIFDNIIVDRISFWPSFRSGLNIDVWFSPQLHLVPTAAALLGGWNITTTFRPPQRGQRKRLSNLDKGKARPRVDTNVCMSSSPR